MLRKVLADGLNTPMLRWSAVGYAWLSVWELVPSTTSPFAASVAKNSDWPALKPQPLTAAVWSDCPPGRVVPRLPKVPALPYRVAAGPVSTMTSALSTDSVMESAAGLRWPVLVMTRVWLPRGSTGLV